MNAQLRSREESQSAAAARQLTHEDQSLGEQRRWRCSANSGCRMKKPNVPKS